MTGGHLQLVAKGPDDAFLINNPQVTLFKTVYRRHAGFSMFPSILNFSRNTLNFGNIARCKIKKEADFMNKMTLVIKLPEIRLKYPRLTQNQVKSILSKYEIMWDKSGDSLFTIEDYNNIKIQTNDKIITLLLDNDTQELRKNIIINKYVSALTARDYTDNVFLEFIKGTSLEVFYNYMVAYHLDTQKTLISNLDLDLSAFYNLLIQSLIITNSIYPFISNTVTFYHIIEFGIYLFSQSIVNSSMKSLFNTVIDLGYSDNPTLFTTDGYVIYNKYFANTTRQLITSQNDIDSTKKELLNDIFYNFIKNILQTTNTLTVLKNNHYTFPEQYRMSIFKRYDYISPGTFNGTNLMSLLSNNSDRKLDDHFSTYILKNNNIPSGFTNYLGNDITNSIQTFNNNIEQIFQSDVITEYLADVNIWSRLKLSGINGSFSSLDSIYLMNTIPYYIIDDIPNMVNAYIALNPTYAGQAGLFNLFNSVFSNGLKTSLLDMYTAYSSGSTNVNLLGHLTALDATYKPNANDKILNAILKPEKLLTIDTSIYTQDVIDYIDNHEIDITDNFNLQTKKITPIEYIIHNYIFAYTQIIFDNFSSQNAIDYLYELVVNQIVNNFRRKVIQVATDTGALISVFPSYSQYKNNNYSLFMINATTPQTILNIGPPYLDAASSLWYYLDLSLIKYFDNLFKTNIINQPTYVSYGNNMKSCLQKFLKLLQENNYDISINYINMNFYKLIIPKSQYDILIEDYNNMIIAYNTMYAKYQQNKLILNIKFVLLSKKTNYYRKFQDIYNLFRTTILNNPTKYISDTMGITNAKILINSIETTLLSLDFEGSIDVKYKVRVDLTHATEVTTNPYTFPSHLYDWYEQSQSHITTHLIDQFDQVMSFLDDSDSSNQFLDSKVFDLYGNFADEIYFTSYMSDLIIKNTPFSTYINKIVSVDKKETQNNFLSIITSQLDHNNKILFSISNNGKFDGSLLSGRLLNSLNENIPPFAWAEEIGHRILEHVSLEIGGKLYDKHTGYFLHCLHVLERNPNQESGYNRQIGNVPELYTFKTDGVVSKNKYTLYIPLQFSCSRNFTSSFPLIAMKNTDIELIVKLNDLTDVALWDKTAIFIKQPKLECKLLVNYGYVDTNDRNRLALTKHQYLYENVQYNGDIIVGKNNIISDNNILTVQTFFTLSCKYIIGQLKFIKIFDTNNAPSVIAGITEKELNDFSWLDNTVTINGVVIKPIKQIKIRTNGNDRETLKDFKVYNLLQSNAYKCGSLDENMFFYSFCLEPKSLQPTGTMNMGKISDFAILFYLDDRVINEIQNERMKVRVSVYAYSYNWLRIMSGMAGSAFD